MSARKDGALVSVGEQAHNGRRHHIAEKERGGQKPELGVAAVEFRLHQRLHRKQHRAVNVVEEIQRGQQQQSQTRVGAGAHEASF